MMRGGWYRAALMAAGLALVPLAAQAEVIEQGTLVFDGIPAPDPAEAGRLEAWLESRQASFQGWLADGSLLVGTRFGEAEQLHRVVSPLGARSQLTFGREPLRGAAPRPGRPDEVLVVQDRGGDENMQFWLLSLRDGSRRLLTDGRALHGTPVWSNDGRRLAWYSNARDGVNYDIHVLDVDAGTPPRMVAGGGRHSYYVQDWNYDDSKLLILSYLSNTQSQLLVLELADGSLRPIEPPPSSPGAAPAPRTLVSAARFSRDGRGVFFLSDREQGFTQLFFTDLYTGQSRRLSAGDAVDIEDLAVAADGRHLAYTRNEGGFSRVVVHDLQRQSDLLLPPLPAGGVVSQLGFDAGGARLAVAVESAQRPRDIHVLDLDAAPGGGWVAWTQSEPGPAGTARHVAAQRFDYPTWDSVGGAPRRIPAFLYAPAGAGPHPVVVDIHGGPESQARPVWDSFRQFLVNELGFAVVVPNVRGSSGYGRQYLDLDNGRLREDSVRDIGALLVWIGAQPGLDAERVVVMGGSYGGYMTLASLVHYGDRLAGGIDVVGISHFVTFLERTSAYRRDMRRSEYGDEREPGMRAFLERISPLTRAEAIRKPLLIVQGMNDPRVPASESEQMRDRIRSQGGEVWYLAARDEGHGFRKKGNRDAYLRAVAAFLRRVAGDQRAGPRTSD